MAGAAAALTARKAGASVLLISRAPGATALSSGAADIAADGDAPLRDAARSVARRPGHPYGVLPDLGRAVADALELLRALGYAGGGERNLWLLSPLGCPKPAALAQPWIAAGDLRSLPRDARPGVAALAGAQAIEARLQAEGLRKVFPQAMVLPVELYTKKSDALRGVPEMAADFDRTGRRAQLAEALGRAARAAGATHLFVPTLGFAPEPIDAGVPVYEMLSAPPSVPGLRLQRAMDAALRRAGVELRAAAVAKADLPPAAATVLATGRFIGGGIRAGGELRETVFGLPAWAGDRRSLPALPGEELFAIKAAGRHAGLAAGVRVGPDLRVPGSAIFAAGAVVGGYDPSRDEGGLGAAAMLGIVAGRNAAAAAAAPRRASA